MRGLRLTVVIQEKKGWKNKGLCVSACDTGCHDAGDGRSRNAGTDQAGEQFADSNAYG